MTTTGDDGRDPQTDRSPQRGRPVPVWALVVLLAAETALLAVASGYLLIELLTARPDSYPAAVAILVLTLAATVWLGAITVGVLRGNAWIRGAAITWQVLQIAVGVGSLQGALANASVGVWLIVPAVLVVVLLFVPSVVAATSHRDDSPPHVY